MSAGDAILLAGVTGAVCAAVAFVVTVWLADREIDRWKTRAGVESAQRIECQERHWVDNEANSALIRTLELENNTLYAEIETIRHGHYRPAAAAPHVVA